MYVQCVENKDFVTGKSFMSLSNDIHLLELLDNHANGTNGEHYANGTNGEHYANGTNGEPVFARGIEGTSTDLRPASWQAWGLGYLDPSTGVTCFDSLPEE